MPARLKRMLGGKRGWLLAALLAAPAAALAVAALWAAPPPAVVALAGGAAMVAAAALVPRLAAAAYTYVVRAVRRLLRGYAVALLALVLLLAAHVYAAPQQPVLHVSFTLVSGPVEPGSTPVYRVDLACTAGCGGGAAHRVEARLVWGFDMHEDELAARDVVLVPGHNYMLVQARLPRRSGLYFLAVLVDGRYAAALPIDAQLPVEVYAAPGAVHVSAARSLGGKEVRLIGPSGHAAAEAVVPRGGGHLILHVPPGTYRVYVGDVLAGDVQVPPAGEGGSNGVYTLLMLASLMVAGVAATASLIAKRREQALLAAPETVYVVKPATGERKVKRVSVPVTAVFDAVRALQARRGGLAVELEELASSLSSVVGGHVRLLSTYATVKKLRDVGGGERLDYAALPHPLSPDPKIYVAVADRRDSVLHKALLRAAADALTAYGLTHVYVGLPGRGGVPDMLAVYAPMSDPGHGYIVIVEAETGVKLTSGDEGAAALVRGLMEHTENIIRTTVFAEDRWRFAAVLVVVPDGAAKAAVEAALDRHASKLLPEGGVLVGFAGEEGWWRRWFHVCTPAELPSVLRGLVKALEEGGAEYIERPRRRRGR